MSLKKTDLDKLLGKKIAGESSSRGGGGAAMSRREQALETKRRLLEKHRKSK